MKDVNKHLDEHEAGEALPDATVREPNQWNPLGWDMTVPL